MKFIHSFIQSGYFYSASLSPLLYSEALPTTVIDSVGVYTTKRYRQPYTVYTVYNIYMYYILLVKDLPKVPGVAARMGFEPTTFRSKGIESTNVPPHPYSFIHSFIHSFITSIYIAPLQVGLLRGASNSNTTK